MLDYVRVINFLLLIIIITFVVFSCFFCIFFTLNFFYLPSVGVPEGV